MNQLAVLANETHEQAIADFKVSERYGYRFILKVKKIRDERLYKELGFATFDAYCEKSWSVDRSYMDQRIVIADSFGNEVDFEDTYPHLGHSKSLLLARMEPEVRQQVESTIDVAATPVKGIKDLEKQLKQAESERVRLENLTITQQQELNKERSKPAIEVVPEEISKKIKQQEQEVERLKSNLAKTEETLKSNQAQLKEFKNDAEQHRKLKAEISDLNTRKDSLNRQIESAVSLAKLSVQVEEMLRTHLAPMRYSRALTEQRDSKAAMQNLSEVIQLVENWCGEMRVLMPSNYIEVEVIK